MKIKFLLLFGMFFLGLQTSYAIPKEKDMLQVDKSQFVSFEDIAKADVVLDKKTIKRQQKATKRFNKVKNLLAKANIDLDDEVEKWMWFWIFGWGAAIALSIIAAIIGSVIVSALASLVGLAGTVCLVLWLVKKFG